MKKCIALIQSIGWLPFLVFLAPCMWGLALWLRDWVLATVAAVLSVYLVLDIWNWVGKKRTAPKEPE